MYPHQAERLTAILEREELDALVATAPASVRYVTGFSSTSQAIDPTVAVLGVVTRARAALVIPAVDAAAVVADGAEAEIVRCYGTAFFADGTARGDAARLRDLVASSAASPGEALLAALADAGVRGGRIGVDESGLSSRAWQELDGRLAGATLVPAAAWLAGARMVKGPYEIECLDRATRIAEEGLNAVIQVLKPGMTDRDAVAVYEAEVVKRGGVPTFALVAAGERSAVPAAPTSGRAVRARDLVRLDVGCAASGYRATVARTAVVGEPSDRQAEVHAAVLAGVEAAIDALRPGASAARVFDGAVGAVRAAGIAGYAQELAGHGVGLEQREPPWLAAGSDAVIEMGMVVLLDTPSFEYGWGGVSVKETVLVTNVGARPLNRSARGLVVLD